MKKKKTGAEKRRTSKNKRYDQVLWRNENHLLTGHPRSVLFLVIGQNGKVRRELGD